MLGSVVFGKVPLVIIVKVVLVPITIFLGLSLVVEAAAAETSPAAGATASREAATAEAATAEATTTKAMATLTTHHLDNDLGVNTTHATTHATTKHIRGVH